jgi:hypothetical protein
MRRLAIGLAVLLLATSAHLVSAQSQLPPCPGSYADTWTNCVGTARGLNGRYVGEWKDGHYNGYGTFTLLNGGKYVGEWRDDKPNGRGAFTWPDGRKYVGEWNDGKNNGLGTVTLPDGRRFVGEWKDDKADGQGVQYGSDGTILRSGFWRSGVFVGHQ